VTSVVGLAASAGGLGALARVLEALPPKFGAPVVVVLHLVPGHRSLLAEILARRTQLVVKQAEEGDLLAAGAAYVAPPDAHLLVHPGGELHLEQSPPVHFLRPSADLLFESLAETYGEQAIVVVLSGSGNDGASGVRAIKEAGGQVIAQDEASSEFYGMPAAAIATGMVDFVLPLEQIPTRLAALVGNG
jgi:two-component system chemotaxis response regulator CheB